MIKKIIKILEKMNMAKILAGSIWLVVMIGIIDYWLPTNLSTALFYVIPIAIATWFSSYSAGIIVSVFATIIWYFCDEGMILVDFIGIWNAFFRLIFFLTITYLISGFRQRLEEEEFYANKDPLTGALNKRSFETKISIEIERAKRFKTPCSLAYIDLDNFKNVNDSLGHSEGDLLLKSVVEILHEETRAIDIVARLGGDEFAVMLIGTDMAGSDAKVRALQSKLLKKMRSSNWDVTFSIGQVSFDIPPENADELVKMADNLMYKVKKNEKNNIVHISWPEE